MTAQDVKTALQAVAEPQRKEASEWFFKTEEGGYSQHDRFIGVTVPNQRQVARRFRDLPLGEVQKLLNSKIHEHRLTALIILTEQFAKASDADQEKIYKFYLKNVHAGRVDNWDLVDTSAHKIMGEYLLDKPRDILQELVHSDNLWQQRVAIIATYTFIKQGEFEDTLAISELLLEHDHDLIHKAVGWMLREMGKQNQAVEEEFLQKHYKQMPRTMLRYAIEKFDEPKRQAYLKGTA